MDNKLNKLEILSNITSLLLQNNDAMALKNSLTEVFQKFLPVETFNIYIYDGYADTTRDYAKYCGNIERDSVLDRKKRIYESIEKLETCDFILNNIPCKSQDSASLSKLQLNIDSNILLYPMKKASKTYGILELKFLPETESIFSAKFFNMLSIASTAISLRIQNDILVERMQANINFHESMKNIAKIIETQYELNYIIPLIGEMLDKFISDHLIYIFLKDSQTSDYKLIWPLACRNTKIFKLIETLDTTKDYTVSDDYKIGVFPLVGENEILGCVVAHSNMDKLTAKEIEYLEQLTKQSSITIHRANVYAEVLKHATLDALTGINNRRQFESRLKQEIATSKRQNKPLCAMMVDIDFFKSVNDTYGHAAGDEVLKHTANVIKEQLREYDIPSRYGGEEFSILLPFTKLEEAFLVAQRLRCAVEQSSVHVEGLNKPIKVTISVGVTEFIDTDTPETLFTRADKALYEAKNHGRNKVVINAE